MGPKCSECFYCRRGTIVTYQPAYTCLHPLVINMGTLARLGGLCDQVRAAEGACGEKGDLYRPIVDEPPEPLHKFTQ